MIKPRYIHINIKLNGVIVIFCYLENINILKRIKERFSINEQFSLFIRVVLYKRNNFVSIEIVQWWIHWLTMNVDQSLIDLTLSTVKRNKNP